MLTSFSRISSDCMEAYTLSVKFLLNSIKNGSLRDIVEAILMVVVVAARCSGGGGGGEEGKVEV